MCFCSYFLCNSTTKPTPGPSLLLLILGCLASILLTSNLLTSSTSVLTKRKGCKLKLLTLTRTLNDIEDRGRSKCNCSLENSAALPSPCSLSATTTTNARLLCDNDPELTRCCCLITNVTRTSSLSSSSSCSYLLNDTTNKVNHRANAKSRRQGEDDRLQHQLSH